MTENNIVEFPPLRQFANRVATAAECAEMDFEPWPKKTDYLSGFQASMQNIWVVITHARGMMSATKSELCTAIEELEQSGELMNMSHSFDNAREALVAFVALIDDATARTVIGVNHYGQPSGRRIVKFWPGGPREAPANSIVPALQLSRGGLARCLPRRLINSKDD